MWLVMLKTYVGRLGLFLKDLKYDLPKEKVAQLPKDSFKTCPAPWDEKKVNAKARTKKQKSSAK
jgi:hypothetical protein